MQVYSARHSFAPVELHFLEVQWGYSVCLTIQWHRTTLMSLMTAIIACKRPGFMTCKASESVPSLKEQFSTWILIFKRRKGWELQNGRSHLFWKCFSLIVYSHLNFSFNIPNVTKHRNTRNFYVITTSFNSFSFVSEKSCFVCHFGMTNSSKYYNTHEPWSPLPWRRSPSQVRIRAIMNSKTFHDCSWE